MGPVSEPAYPGTAAAGLSARSMELLLMIKIEDKEAAETEETDFQAIADDDFAFQQKQLLI